MNTSLFWKWARNVGCCNQYAMSGNYAFIGYMRVAFFFAILLLAVVGCSEESDTPAPVPKSSIVSAVVMPAPITKEQAVTLISELPEIKAWSGYLQQVTEYEVHAAIWVLPEEPVTNDGKQYWSVGFYEEQATHFHRWETFLVGLDSKEVLIDDIEDGAISLHEWRSRKKPDAMIDGG